DLILWREVQGIKATKSASRAGLDYLYVEQPDRPAYLLSKPDLQGQIFRRVIANKLGIGTQYDLQTFPFAKNAQATLETLTRRPAVTTSGPKPV
ncbi:MAG TPA: hypothetical protein VNT26_23905, partial [Candidatus Sulfotelmatobacter sp.]|nr:hypothetical protein [Candidatus Sulfotelmatobacter sp.]